jgi:predicted ATPase
MCYPIKKLTIEGFKSIRRLDAFELRPVNVLIGANGAGKSKFVFFSSAQLDFIHFLAGLSEGVALGKYANER